MRILLGFLPGNPSFSGKNQGILPVFQARLPGERLFRGGNRDIRQLSKPARRATISSVRQFECAPAVISYRDEDVA
jgi:hypothetical protein